MLRKLMESTDPDVFVMIGCTNQNEILGLPQDSEEAFELNE